RGQRLVIVALLVYSRPRREQHLATYVRRTLFRWGWTTWRALPARMARPLHRDPASAQSVRRVSTVTITWRTARPARLGVRLLRAAASSAANALLAPSRIRLETS